MAYALKFLKNNGNNFQVISYDSLTEMNSRN